MPPGDRIPLPLVGLVSSLPLALVMSPVDRIPLPLVGLVPVCPWHWSKSCALRGSRSVIINLLVVTLTAGGHVRGRGHRTGLSCLILGLRRLFVTLTRVRFVNLRGVDLAALGGSQLGGQTFSWLSPRSMPTVGCWPFRLRFRVRVVRSIYRMASPVLSCCTLSNLTYFAKIKSGLNPNHTRSDLV